MDSYKEYLYYLLHAPFKKVKREANHWKILMEVFGEQFDGLKEYIFLIRDQSAIDTATSSRALDIIGDGMKMKRFTGESDERFRKRLIAKRAIAEMAGTKTGILYTMQSMGLEKASILPVPDQLHPDQRDMQRWAEFILQIEKFPSGIKDYELIKEEVRRVKQASSKLAGIRIITKEKPKIEIAIHERHIKKIISEPDLLEQMQYDKKLHLGTYSRQVKKIEAQVATVSAADDTLTMEIGIYCRMHKIVQEV